MESDEKEPTGVAYQPVPRKGICQNSLHSYVVYNTCMAIIIIIMNFQRHDYVFDQWILLKILLRGDTHAKCAQ